VKELNVLIAFSYPMEDAAEKLGKLCESQGIKLKVSYKVTDRKLLTDDRLNTVDCLFIQEFLDEGDPVTVDYLRNFDVFNNLRVICVFSERRRAEYSSILYANGFYDCIFDSDTTHANLVSLFTRGRNKKQAQIYYGIKDSTPLDVYSDNIDGLDEFVSFIKLHLNEKDAITEKFDKFTRSFNDVQIRLMVTELPSEISGQLLHIEKFKEQYDDIKSKMVVEDDVRSIGKIKAVREKQVVNETIKYIIPVTGAKNIGVCSLSSGAGSTFITMNLAAALSEYVNISVIEPPIDTPYIYDTLGIRGYLAESDATFYPFAHYIEEDKNIEYNKEFKYNNISWIVTDPDLQKVVDWNFYKMIKLMYVSKQTNLSLIDIGINVNHDSIKGVLEQFDMFLVIVDPFVTQYMNNHDMLLYFKKLKAEGVNVEFIINKFNGGVDKKRMLDYLDIKPVANVPFICPEHVYKAAYDCVLPYEIKEVRQDLESAFSGLIDKLIPKELMKNKSIRSNKKFSFFRRK
jgi:MinD-like ATPase involved in chromosome partitioning or flagellar assembly